jgi:hypothetical protein
MKRLPSHDFWIGFLLGMLAGIAVVLILSALLMYLKIPLS